MIIASSDLSITKWIWGRHKALYLSAVNKLLRKFTYKIIIFDWEHTYSEIFNVKVTQNKILELNGYFN